MILGLIEALGGGYLAANTIAEHLGLAKWWPEPEIITVARGKGLV
jgi:hypothetical protein